MPFIYFDDTFCFLILNTILRAAMTNNAHKLQRLQKIITTVVHKNVAAQDRWYNS
jgi:hypothetical protein